MSGIEQADRILELLSEREAPVPFGEIVSETGLPKSSIHGVLRRMQDLQWIERLDGPRYRIALRLVQFARTRLNTEVTRRFIEVCDRLKKIPNEAVVLSILEGTDVIYLACRNGSRPFGVQYQIGMRLPAATTASGKAVLAQLDEDEIRARFAAGVPTNGAGSEKSVDELLAELERTRERGFSIDDEETAPGMICFGAGVPQGQMNGCAVAISLIKASITEADHDSFGREVMDLANALT